MKARAGKKKVVLELGRNAAAIVDETADLDWAAERCAYGAFKYGGQLCISVQRDHRPCRRSWTGSWQLFVARARELRVGDPSILRRIIGPMIDAGRPSGCSAGSTRRSLTARSRTASAERADGTFMPPTVLVDVDPPTQPIVCEEAFGPVAVVSSSRRLRARRSTR